MGDVLGAEFGAEFGDELALVSLPFSYPRFVAAATERVFLAGRTIFTFA